jgi:hypothetical protein
VRLLHKQAQVVEVRALGQQRNRHAIDRLYDIKAAAGAPARRVENFHLGRLLATSQRSQMVS